MARGRSFIVTTSDMRSLAVAAGETLGYIKQTYPAKDYSQVYKAI